jgi:hypothetical protein
MDQRPVWAVLKAARPDLQDAPAKLRPEDLGPTPADRKAEAAVNMSTQLDLRALEDLRHLMDSWLPMQSRGLGMS